MRDQLADALVSKGKNAEREFVFQKHFLGNSDFVGVPYDKMPKKMREALDYFAIFILDPNNSRTIITGSPFVGKSFMINQLYYNREVFSSRAKTEDIEFVATALEHSILVHQNTPGRWTDYVEIAMGVYGKPLHNLIFVTESLDAAIGIAEAGGRVVLEANPPALNQLRNLESQGTVKHWSSWNIIDLDSVFYDKTTIVESLAAAHLESLNLSYPEIALTRKHIALLVNWCVNNGELTIQEEMGTPWTGYIVAPPGVMARALFHFAATLAFDFDIRKADGKLNYGRAIRDTYENLESLFSRSFYNFMQAASEYDESPNGADALHDFITDQLSGIPVGQTPDGNKIFRIDATKLGKQTAPAQNETEYKFADMSTLGERLKKIVLGQDDAINQVADGLRVPAAGLNLETKPLRSMLFLGPTGVGKTQLALSLAKELMDTPLPVKRVDMSEFGEAHESSKLFGAPPGYVGHDAGGVLTNFVQENPRSIVILDEIEKAHPKIWDSFLQILDAGRMTDSRGLTVDFTQTIVIMTSNLGASKIKQNSTGFVIGSHEESYKARVADSANIVRKAVESEFRPEFVNRIDQLVIFNELSTDVLHNVIAKEIDEATVRIKARGYTLEKPTDEILAHIANMSDASKYGAREIQRIVGTNILELLAEKILASSESKELALAIEGGKLVVSAKETASESATESEQVNE